MYTLRYCNYFKVFSFLLYKYYKIMVPTSLGNLKNLRISFTQEKSEIVLKSSPISYS